jgi:hypothetical protein
MGQPTGQAFCARYVGSTRKWQIRQFAQRHPRQGRMLPGISRAQVSATGGKRQEGTQKLFHPESIPDLPQVALHGF